METQPSQQVIDSMMFMNDNGLSLEGLRIVVVEKDAVLRELIADIIIDLNGECLPFESADDALIRLHQIYGECALIIFDIGVLGVMKGEGFLDMVSREWPEIPMIISSGYGIEAGRSRQRSRFLFKPWSICELLQAMSLALRHT